MGTLKHSSYFQKDIKIKGLLLISETTGDTDESFHLPE